MLRHISCLLWLSMGRSSSFSILSRQSLNVAFSSSERCRASREVYLKNEYCPMPRPSDVPRMRSGWKSSPRAFGVKPGLNFTFTTWPGAKLVTVPSW